MRGRPPRGFVVSAVPMEKGRWPLSDRGVARHDPIEDFWSLDRDGPAFNPHEGMVMKIKDAASETLALKRVAVTGVSRTPATHGSNVVFRRLQERGYDVYAVNPNATDVEGAKAYPDLRSIPGGVEWVVIATKPERAEATMEECVDLGIKHVWMHRAFGSSVSDEATKFGREHGVTVIDGGCPLMFEPTSDGGHKMIRFFCSLTGAVPRTV